MQTPAARYAGPSKAVLEQSLIPDTPRSALRQPSRSGELHVSPVRNASRDWEGFVQRQREGEASSRSIAKVTAGRPPLGSVSTTLGNSYNNSSYYYGRSESPSVATLQPAEVHAKQQLRGRLDVRFPEPKDRPDYLLDHQAHLEWRRQEYKKRMEAEARGEVYMSNRPYSDDFLQTLPSAYADPAGTSGAMPLDFESRSRELFAGKPQVIGTREEIAWLQPPPIPMPIGWTGYWDLCHGHEAVLQLMALSGANPDNSPSLTQHFMYPELLSAIQRLQYGTYAVHYSATDSPHERYFYIKSLPLANRGQFCPFFCWSVHRHSHCAMDAIPLCNVMWVTQGIDSSEVMQKYWIGGDYIHGPYVNNHRSECLVHGAITVWVYNGKKLRAIDFLCPDPLVFTLWMKLLEDFAQLNAALDLTGNVRALQKDLETSKARGELAGREMAKKKKGASIFSSK